MFHKFFPVGPDFYPDKVIVSFSGVLEVVRAWVGRYGKVTNIALITLCLHPSPVSQQDTVDEFRLSFELYSNKTVTSFVQGKVFEITHMLCSVLLPLKSEIPASCEEKLENVLCGPITDSHVIQDTLPG